jgi:outer membrane protein insertion porin family
MLGQSEPVALRASAAALHPAAFLWASATALRPAALLPVSAAVPHRAALLPVSAAVPHRAAFLPASAAALLVSAAALVTAVPARAQEVLPEVEHPRVERITFNGAQAIEAADLRGAIMTRQTQCRGFLLQPICALTNWHIVHNRHFLDRAEHRADVLRLRLYYFQRGYRRAQVASSLRPRGRGVEVIFDIDEGPPTIVASRTVEQTRDVLSRRQIRRAALPEEGQPLDLLRLSSALVQLEDRLGRHGHLDASVHDTASFSPDGLSAHLDVRIEPGPRSTLAALDVVGNEGVSERTIADALRLRMGRVLRSNDLVASQRSLYESNLFHEARVSLPAQQDSAKRVEVEVREAPLRAARIGAGFNTAEFVQIEGRLTHYNLMGGGRRVDTRVTVGNLLAGQLTGRGFFGDARVDGPGIGDPDTFLRPTWIASIELMQPAFRSAANVIGASVFTHRRIIPGIVVDEGLGGELSFTHRLDYRTPVSAAYRFETVSVDAGDLYFCVNYAICELPTIAALQQRHQLSPLVLSYDDNHANHPLAPTSGYRVRVDAEHASSITFSDFQYNRISGEATGYYPLDVHRRRVLAGRLRFGWVQPLAGTAAALAIDEEFSDLLHPRKRFFAGGARSVRGFRENQLGPRVLTINPNVLLEEGGCAADALAECDPNEIPVGAFRPRPAGGRNVIEGSVEYRFPLSRTLQGAVFVDGARVGESLGGVLSNAVAAVTPGFGVRYGSPVGPIRIDLGFRPQLTEELAVITEITDADGERRLVRLQTPRMYDPIESGGFLAQLFGRLRLHLSIGEAY